MCAGGSFQVPSTSNIADTIPVDKDLVSGAVALGTFSGRGAVASAAGEITKQLFDEDILDTPWIVGGTGSDFEIDSGSGMGEPEVNNSNMFMVIKPTQVLTSDFFHQVVVGVNISAGLPEEDAHCAFP